jgi:drug/metabolite transporter (DMT)-like permease
VRAGLCKIINWEEVTHNMVWFLTALVAAIISSVGNIIDSHLLSKKMPSLPSFLIPMGLTQLIGGVVFLAIFPFPANPDLMYILVACGAGLLNACGYLIILNSLRKSEVSRVIPVISSAPIFVALLSIPLLGEMLNLWQWFAIVITVAGAVLISLQMDGGGRKARLQKSFFILLLVALMLAVASIGFKYALEKISFWNMWGINGISIATVILIYSVRKKNILELRNLNQRTRNILIIVVDVCLGITAGILGFKALEIGHVALVNALLNVRPAFVFIFSLVLSAFFPTVINDRLNKRTALIKFIAVTLMTVGIVIISLSS